MMTLLFLGNLNRKATRPNWSKIILRSCWAALFWKLSMKMDLQTTWKPKMQFFHFSWISIGSHRPRFWCDEQSLMCMMCAFTKFVFPGRDLSSFDFLISSSPPIKCCWLTLVNSWPHHNVFKCNMQTWEAAASSARNWLTMILSIVDIIGFHWSI